MEKDFDGWNVIKKNIELSDKHQHFQEREIWWCSIGINIGSEQDGKNGYYERPVLIIKKFNRNTAWAISITSNSKDRYGYYQISNDGRINSLILPQLKLISVKRLRRFVRRISTYEFAMVCGELIDLMQYK